MVQKAVANLVEQYNNNYSPGLKGSFSTSNGEIQNISSDPRVAGQLNSFFDGYNSETNQTKLFDTSIKNKHISQFIKIIIEEIEEYNLLFNICNKNDEFEHNEALLNHAYRKKIMQSDKSQDIRDFIDVH